MKKKNTALDQDFYVENGLVVFTEKFLKNRGYCCKSGCRHCPYGYIKMKT
ncbi:MAG: hypothetical protein IPL63_13010 [Saprospiraceae bacterium]|nr:hypothetical protein [Saprospiraceae bacterium]MBK6566109.1 hypothetical protein [Saprospiraceae bacterium]MBK6784400.1 hypothetical protein [Saprospiraceae bacterium]MBK7525717.1 hypothetical protein [Saprospiraceae bacterium]MBK8369873.1 hypothetical protein [Saprospiraceae bacterium]